MKKWYTCTPFLFRGDHTFFCRDSGLFSMAFQEAGCESRVVMPLPDQEGDYPPNLIRTEYRNLEDAEWWKSLQLDGVLLYAWGAPRYRKIARAIHESGTKLVIYLDTGNGFYPLYDWKKNTQLLYERALFGHKWGWSCFLRDLIKENVVKLALSEPRRKAHLSYADMILVPVPSVLEIMKPPRFYYGDLFKNRMELVCCPVPSYFRYNGEKKEKRILAIGRWDDYFQKRPDFLCKTLALSLEKDDSVKCVMIGRGVDELAGWRDSLPAQVQTRIELRSYVPNGELPALYGSSMISLCPSRYESTHIVSAEALCCGCSIVASDRAGMAAFQWYASASSGTLARVDTPESLSDALMEELGEWEQGRRDPVLISQTWCKRFHAIESVKRILEWDRTNVLPDFQ